MTPSRQEWLDAVLQNPGDIQLRMVYADYLEDMGDYVGSHRQRGIVIGWPLMGDFEPHNIRINGSPIFSVWVKKNYYSRPFESEVEWNVWNEVNLPIPSDYPSAKDATSRIQCMEEVAIAYAKVRREGGI